MKDISAVPDRATDKRRPAHRFSLTFAPATSGAVVLLASIVFTQSAVMGPEVQSHIAAATAAAGSDLTAALTLCDATRNTSVATREEVGNAFAARVRSGMSQRLEPTRVFDNLYFVGQRWVSAWVLRTSKGLILFDAMDNRQEAEYFIEGGLRQLGLNPADIKFLVITHAHFDHYGGAPYLAEKYGTRLVMSETDWSELAKVVSLGTAMDFGAVPKRNPDRDLAVQNGDTLTLGDTTVLLFVTPGHTPGTLSPVFTVKDQGRNHRAMLWGGTAFNFGRVPDRLTTYADSTLHFADVVRREQVDVLMSNHVSWDDGVAKMSALKQRKSGAAHPFVVGMEVPQRYLTVLRECALATRASILPVERGDPFEH